MAAYRYNIAIDQGSSLELPFTFKDSNGIILNLTGYSARMQVRKSFISSSVELELTTSNGGISIVGVLGKLTLIVSAVVTATLLAKRFVYDLELVSPSGFVSRVLQGLVIVSPEVTR